MPKTRKEEIIFTTIGVILMCFIMTAFNKFRFIGEFSAAYFKQVLIGFLQKFPIAWLYQYFIAQPYAAKKATSPDIKGVLGYKLVRIKYTVIISCPAMSLYSCLVAALEKHLTLYQFINNWIPSMCINAVFAFFVQFFILNWANVAVYKLVYPKSKYEDREENKY